VTSYSSHKGSGLVLPTPLVEAFYDGYDDQGDLFADGFNAGRFSSDASRELRGDGDSV
jgi:hypothetical protein